MTQRKPTAALEDAPVFHPLLLAICPILGLFAYNVGTVSWTVLIRPVVVVLVIAEALLIAFWIGLRDKHKAGIIASFLLLALMWGWSVLETAIGFFFPLVQALNPAMVYGAGAGLLLIASAAIIGVFRRDRRQAFLYVGGFLVAVLVAGLAVVLFLDRVYGAIASAFILAYVGVVGLAVARIAVWRRDFKPWTRTANWFGVILVVLYAALIFFNIPRGERASPPPLDVAANETVETAGRPDIYLFLLEGYARCDVLLKVYSYNDLPALEALQKMGVDIEGSAFANYSWDLQSAASLLNMDYLDTLLESESADTAGSVIDLYHNNRFFRTLKDAGYDILAFSPGVQVLEPGPLVDETLSPPRTPSEFEVVLLQGSACKRIMELVYYIGGRDPRAWQFGFRRARVDYVFDTVGDVAAEEHDAPRLVFAHVTIPDPPFMFERKGEWVDPREPKTIEERYISQLHYTSKKITHAVDAIVDRAGRPAVVLIASTHGPGFHNGETPEAVSLAERFGVLFATRYPEESGDAPPEGASSSSLVNALRTTLNRGLGAGLPMLDDKAYLTPPEGSLSGEEVTVPTLESTVAPVLEDR